MSEDITQLARDYMTAFRNRDEAWWDHYIAPEFVRHDPGLDFEVRGPEGMRKLGEFLHRAFSQVELPISDAVMQGDKVLLRLRMQGVHTGDFNGTPASGERIDIDVMDLFRVADGRLVEHWALMDNLGMLKQIGALKT